MRNFRIPRRFSAFLIFAFLNAAFLSLLRVVFYLANKPQEGILPALSYKAFWIGGRFDLRIAFLFALPLGIAFLFPQRKWLKKTLLWLYTLAFGALMFVYFVDFGYFAYLSERLNAYIFELAANTVTSAEMVWQSYPVLTLALLLLVLMAAFWFLFRKLLNFAYGAAPAKKSDYWFALVALLITAAFVHGRFSQYPLRWSNAYFSNNAFVSALALNPVQNLFDTYKFAKGGITYDEAKTREYYDAVADYLGVKDKNAQTLNFERMVTPPPKDKDYNVVIILTESFAYDKSSFNNPELQTTPEMAALARKGRLFTSFFTPTAGTARGVFTSITGLPDTSAVKTSSRNPMIVSQHTLINDLKGYDKFYFIGGSTNWGNIRGLLQYNIEGLKIYEEGTYEGVNRNDVWGLSDLDMFRYAAKVLSETKEPFFAFIQTSGFHRPYTIPDDHGGFEEIKQDEDLLKEYGFSGNEEYNSMRFQDYAMGEFFRLIEDEPFYKNTYFFVYGDHSLTTWQSRNTPQGIIDLELTTNNTPLIVTGPGIAPSVDDKPASQVDITATMAGLLGKPYRETALGRNLFDEETERGAFVLASSGTPLRIGFVEDEFYYTIWPAKEGLFKYRSNDAGEDYCAQYPQKCERMRKLARGLYETAKYMTFHNK